MSAYASQFGYFFDSISGDRTYNSESFEDWLKPFFVSGVFNGNLQVTAQETPDMTVNVAPGRANLDGKLAKWTGKNVMALSPASGVYDRIDTIVLRRDNVNRRISIEVVTGTASLNPSPTAPVRNVDTYELVIAQILVGVGVTSISQANITDTRMNSDVCGWVVATVDQIDFDQIKAQFDGWMADTEQAYNEWKSGVEDDLEDWENDTKGDFTDWEDGVKNDFDDWENGVKSDFDDWFDAIKDQLDSDAAGHLQLEIDALSSSKANKSTAVSITALANGWSNAEPSTQSIAVAGMTSATKFLIGAGALTQTQLEAMIAGLIQCTAQGAGSITLTCYGDVPEIDLPVQIVIVD